MPRLARLDAPGILHHVMGRGIERKQIFINDTDRSDFIDRLTALAEEGAMDVYAWVLMPNHFHLLCKTHNRALSSSMRKNLIRLRRITAAMGIYFRTDTSRLCVRSQIRLRRKRSIFKRIGSLYSLKSIKSRTS
jgi:REP element-mobilizing transposase RayT